MGDLDVSVVVAAHNAANRLPTCLAHLEQQHLAAARYEIIVVDAAGTDGSAALLEAHCGGAPVRTRPLRAPGPEIIPAINLGIHASEGRTVVLLGPELLASPGLLDAHCEAQSAAERPTVGIGAVLPHPQVNPHRLARWTDFAAPAGDGPVDYLDLRAVNVALPRGPLLAEGGLDARFTDPDLAMAELMFRLARHGVRAVRAPAAIAYCWVGARASEERARAYLWGYSLPLLAELTDAEAVRRRHPMPTGTIRNFLGALLLRFSSDTWPDGEAPEPGWTGLQRRIFTLHAARGWRDAQRGRPPRPREPAP